MGPPRREEIDALHSKFTLEMIDAMPFPTAPIGALNRTLTPFQKGNVPSVQAERPFEPEESWRALYPPKILSDDALVTLLKERGFDVARRTVAKYREAAGIGSSVQRRRAKKLAGR